MMKMRKDLTGDELLFAKELQRKLAISISADYWAVQKPKPVWLFSRGWSKRWRDKPCAYCGRSMSELPSRKPTRDHVIPQHKNSIAIILVCCFKCNLEKGGKFIDDWLIELNKTNDIRAEYVKNYAQYGRDFYKNLTPEVIHHIWYNGLELSEEG
jgi:hypothetical protein